MIFNFIEWIKTRAIIILGVVVAVETAALIVVVLGRGVIINQYTTNQSISTANSYASSAALNQTLVYDSFRVQGKWEIIERYFETHTKVVDLYRELNPIQLMFTKETYNSDECFWVITYPVVAETKQTTTKTEARIK